MAITKVSQYNSSPTVVADYQAQNAYMQAMINKANGSMSILNQTSTTSVPYIAVGTYIMMGGTLYIVDTEDYTILGSVVSGSNYIYLTVSGDNLTATWVQTITSYSWNNIYNYYSDGTNVLLPYVVSYDFTNYYIGTFQQNFKANQDLLTDSDVEFGNITTGYNGDITTGNFGDITTGPSGSIALGLAGHILPTTSPTTLGGSLEQDEILTFPRGCYMWTATGQLSLSVNGGTTYALAYYSGSIFSDGTNIILKNLAATTTYIAYKKF